MVRAYCHKVIKLSDALQSFCPPGKEVTCNVHGVRDDFWKQGLQLAEQLKQQQQHQQQGAGGEGDLLFMEPRAYFLGKLLWAKGLDILLDLQEYYKQGTGSYFEIDIYGSGPDAQDIERAYLKKKESSSSDNNNNGAGESPQTLPPPIRRTLPPMTLKRTPPEPIPATFYGRVDHAHLPHNYTVFVNPSLSEVLCTTTAEALAMGKFVIVPYHPSNYWFFQFPNCLPYRNKLEFAANLRWALSHNPEPLTAEQAMEFSWQAATERLFQAAAMTHREAAAALHVNSKQEAKRIAWFHNEVLGKGTRGDIVRKVLGAGPVSEQVRYQQERTVVLANNANNTNNNNTDDEQVATATTPAVVVDGGSNGAGGDDENEGLGQGFAQSWFVTAFRRAWSDAAKMGSVPTTTTTTTTTTLVQPPTQQQASPSLSNDIPSSSATRRNTDTAKWTLPPPQ